MKSYQLQRELLVPLRLPEVFAFFSDARNLGRITPPWLRFAIRSDRDLTMREGLQIDYRIRLYGLPMAWRSLISVWEPPFRFVDEQLRGPYHAWRHEHTFEEIGDGTRVRDRVEYRPRGGAAVHRYLVRPNLERIFDFRTHALEGLSREDW